MRIIDLFDKGADLYPENIAFMDATGQYSYREASECTHSIASALHRNNFGKGSHVALLAPNSNIAFLSVLGIFRAGGVWLPVNPRCSVARTADLLHRFDGDLLLYDSGYEEQATNIARLVPCMSPAVCIDDKQEFQEFQESVPMWIGSAEANSPPIDHSPNEALLISPLGPMAESADRVVVTHDNVARSFANFHTRFHSSGNTRYLILAPLGHSSGVLACLHFSSGGSNIIMNSVDPGSILRTIQDKGITHLFATAALLNLMLAHPFVTLYDYSSLQLFMIDGAAVSAEKLALAVKVFGPVIATIYGESPEKRDANCQISRYPFWYNFDMEHQLT